METAETTLVNPSAVGGRRGKDRRVPVVADVWGLRWSIRFLHASLRMMQRRLARTAFSGKKGFH